MFTISLEKNPKLCPLWNCSTCILQRCLRAPCLSHLHLLSVPSHQVIIKLWPHLGSCSHRSHSESPIIEDTLKSYCDCSHLKHRCNMSVTLCYTPMLPLPLAPITKTSKANSVWNPSTAPLNSVLTIHFIRRKQCCYFCEHLFYSHFIFWLEAQIRSL